MCTKEGLQNPLAARGFFVSIHPRNTINLPHLYPCNTVTPSAARRLTGETSPPQRQCHFSGTVGPSHSTSPSATEVALPLTYLKPRFSCPPGNYLHVMYFRAVRTAPFSASIAERGGHSRKCLPERLQFLPKELRPLRVSRFCRSAILPKRTNCKIGLRPRSRPFRPSKASYHFLTQ